MGNTGCWNSTVWLLELRQHEIDSQWLRLPEDIVTIDGWGSFAPFLLVLQRFMPEIRKSKAWITESCLQRFYSWNSATISSSIYDSNRYPQIRSIKGNQPQNISRRLQIILIISIPWPQLKWILSNHSFWLDDPAQQSLSCHFSHFSCLPSYEGWTSQDTFFCCKLY